MTASSTTGDLVVRSVIAQLAGIAIASVLAVTLVAVSQDPGLRIVVLEGEDGVNIIGQGTAVPTVVEVRDRNDLPVSGASVLFLLGEGGTATLNAGLSQVAVTTNALGQAAVTVNPLASGAVQLQVSAAFQGQTATAAIVQSNVVTAAATGGAAGGAAGTAGAGGGTGGGATGAAAGGTGGGLGTGGVVGVVAGSVGAAVAGVAVARDAAPAPPVAALRITPNGLGMAGLTEYRFDASGSSDPNEDALTYLWDFGDGGLGTGVTVTHVYATAGTYDVTLTLNDGGSEVATSGSVEVGRDLNGRFVGNWVSEPGPVQNNCGSVPVASTLDLRQDGRMLSGNLEDFGQSRCGPYYFYWSFVGSIASSNFVCPCEIRLDMRYTGFRPGTPSPESTEPDKWEGLVAAGADSIDFHFCCGPAPVRL